MLLSFASHLAAVATRLLTGEPLSYSPFCLCLAVLLLLSSTAEADRPEIAQALGITDFSDSAVEALLASLRTDPHLELAANVFSRGLRLGEPYRALLQRVYGAVPQRLESAAQVNAWASEVTHGMIPRILESIDGTAAVLLGALYFRGQWSLPFEAARTVPHPFHHLDGSESQPPTMSQTERMGYRRTEAAHLLSLQFRDTDIRGLLVLPDEPGEKALREALAPALATRTGFSPKKVHLVLPRFRAESTLALNDFLQGLGAKNMFSRGLETTEAFGEPLVVTDVVQRAVVELDEEGVRAAAVTGIVMNTCMPAAPEETLEFVCDRPFWFALMHGDVPLFVSAVTRL